MDRPMPNFAFNMMSSIQRVQNIVSKKQLTNVETIHSDCQTGLPDDSVDIVLLYDIFHMHKRSQILSSSYFGKRAFFY